MSHSPRTAIIGGTSMLRSKVFSSATPHKEKTPFGTVDLLISDSLVFLQRHGVESYSPPHKINHFAHMAALKQLQVTRILAFGSVGGLRKELPPGTLLCPDDFFAPNVNLSYFDDQRGHQVPGFDRDFRELILKIWAQAKLPEIQTHGTYLQTRGPRFETPAEIRFYAQHAHVVGMTVAAECLLAKEQEIPYAAVCIVDNMGNGLDEKPLSYEAFQAQVAENEELVLHILETLTNNL